ncbi:hypothetical protein M514_09164, partial [Trichuris suis]
MSSSMDETEPFGSPFIQSDEFFDAEDRKCGNDFHDAFIALIEGLQLTARNAMLQFLSDDDDDKDDSSGLDATDYRDCCFEKELSQEESLGITDGRDTVELAYSSDDGSFNSEEQWTNESSCYPPKCGTILQLSSITTIYASSDLEDITVSNREIEIVLRSFPAYYVAINEKRRTPLAEGYKRRPVVIDGRSFQNPVDLMICLQQFLKAGHHCSTVLIPESTLSYCSEEWANVVDCLTKKNLLVLTSSDEDDVATQLNEYLMLLAYFSGAVILSNSIHLKPLSGAKEWRQLASSRIFSFSFNKYGGVVADPISRHRCASIEWMFNFTNVENAPITIRPLSEGQFASFVDELDVLICQAVGES